MKNLPNELILIIFGYINELFDMCNFIMTCKKYNNLTKKLMENVKYLVYEIVLDEDSDEEHYPIYNLISVCDNMELCYKCVKQDLSRYNALYENNYYILNGTPGKIKPGEFYKKNGFIIERILTNKLIK